jgi:signal transduction histidine kinase/CheY-like chemotaxis protein
LPLSTRDFSHVCISLTLVTGLGTVLNHRLNRWRRLEFAALETERQTNALLAKEVEEQARTAGNLKAQTSVLEARLATAQRLEAMGRLAGGVAHDLNNLLTPIMGYTELAMFKSKASPDIMEMLKEVKSATMNAKDLVAHLLAVGCRQQLSPTTFDMGDFLREHEAQFRSLLRDNVRLRFEGASHLPVVADRTQMMQVLVNLVVNARDALPVGGDIVIRLAAGEVDASRAIELGIEQNGSYAVVSVEDNGTGMGQDTRERLFEPFFTTKPKGMGTGLGLATVYGILRQHQGAIHVESVLGKGSTFTLWLPSTTPTATDNVPPMVPATSGREGGDETILVVDDDVVVRQLMSRLLTGVGYQVISAGSGPGALEAARVHTGPVHLAVCDMVMPGMHGPELWERLRVARPESRVLFVSGFTNETLDPPHAQRLLGKPFTRADLLGRVRAVLNEERV